jgi:hypothetical protein
MTKQSSVRWIRVSLLTALVACSGEPTTAPEPIAAPQASWNSGSNYSWFDADPDLQWIAKFRTQPAPPDPLNARKNIGPAGGSLRVGDFEIIVPPGAVDRQVNFRIKVPTDPRQSIRAFAEFEPHMVFRKPVTIRLPAAATEVNGTPWAMWWSGFFWLPLPTRSTNDGRIEADVWHFSVYGTSRFAKGITTLGG